MEGNAGKPETELRIQCTNCPKLFFENKLLAKQHFREFGEIKKLIFRKVSKVIVVEYLDKYSFLNALSNAGKYNDCSYDVEVEDKVSPVKKKRVPKDPDPDWTDDPEVRAELEAMGGLSVPKDYNLRPEGMAVDTLDREDKPKVKPKVVPKLKRTWKTLEVPVKKEYLKKKVVPEKPVVKKKVLAEKVSSFSFTNEQIELINLIKQQNNTVEEKYRCLDARDKLVRILFKKKNISSASATKGVCPDMCPEKERLMRETQHQVAIYEQEEGGRGMNPNLAVKQYSRSSADQEAPLPYELRPVSVLQMTMGYLLHKIVDLCDTTDVNMAEWYHFLWDRTRGIRKDITQQELCCQGSVELVEQCARFHIHCSARLAGEDPSVFDQKINTENLTKCLQTLKYMYHDLQLKGESCPHEAEFRAYIILLNLNDGNFMWEVQQLKPEIQKSPEVKFALEVYSALDKNNYVKFFKLVHTTTYLNACILMRYFVQIRGKAIETYLRCYSRRSFNVLIPLNKLIALLAFDDFESAVDFFASYGLNIVDDSDLVLDQSRFDTPEFPYTLDRSTIIEQKRLSSVGEVICGKPLPPKIYETHKPLNSFDDKGCLILNEYLSESDIKLVNPSAFIDLSQDDSSDKSLFTRKTESPKLLQKESTKATSIFQKTRDLDEKNEAKSIFGHTTVFGEKQTSIAIPTDPTRKSMFVGDGPPLIFGEKPKTSEVLWNKPKIEKPLFGDNSSIFGQKQPLFADDKKAFGEPNQISIFGSKPAFGNQSIFGNKETKRNIPVIPADEPDANAIRPIFGGTFPKPPESTKGGFKFDLNKPVQENKSIFGNAVPSGDKTNLIQPRFSIPRMPISPDKVEHKQSEEELLAEQHRVLRERLEKEQQMLNEQLNKEREEQKRMEEKRRIEEELKKKQEEEELKRKEAEEKRKRTEQEMRRKMEEMKKKKEEEMRKREALRLKEEQKKREEEQRKKRALEEKERLRNIEIQQTVKSVIFDLITTVEKNIQEETLKAIKKKISDRLVKNVFYKWKQNVVSNKRKRKAVDCSPVWISTKTVTQEAEELHTTNQDLTLQFMKRYKKGVPYDINTLAEQKIEKIGLLSLTYASLIKRFYQLGLGLQKNIFWKVTISLPSVDEVKNGLTRIEETLDSFIQWKPKNGVKVLVEQSKAYSQCVTYCLERQQGFKVENSDANGIIFIAEDFNVHLQQRLIELLKKYGIFVKVPIVILLQKYDPQSQSKLKMLIAEKIVSDYVILVDNFVPQNLMGLIEEGLIFLSNKLEKPPPLELDTLKSFITKNLCTEIWKRANSFTKWNSNYRTCLRNPSTVINLYNEGLASLKKIVLNKACLEYAPFPSIFKEHLESAVPDFLPCNYRYFPDFWKNKSYLKKLTEILDSLKLPKYKEKWPPIDESELEFTILKYSEGVFKNPTKAFYKIMSVLLRDVDPNVDFYNIENVLWTDVVEVLGLELLNESNLSLKGTEYFKQSVFDEFIVVYDVNTLNDYCKSDWFYLTNPMINSAIQEQLDQQKNEPTPAKKPTLDLNSSKEVEKTLEDVTNKLQLDRNVSKMKEDLKEFNVLLDDLESSIKIHKKISSTFESTLRNIIADK